MTTVFIPRDGSSYTDHPSGLKVEYRDASHRYWLHPTDGGRLPVPSVTGVLKVLDKPALIGWSEEQGILGALEAVRRGELSVDTPNPVGVVRALKLGADAARDAGADRGTSLHDALEAYVTTGAPPRPGDFPDEHRGYVQALCRWLLTARPEPLQVELCVGSVEHGFAGRLDLIARIDGKRTLVDLKTNAAGRVWDEPHLQVAAYRLALVECGHDDVDASVVVALGAHGGYEALPGDASADEFLDVLRTHGVVKRLRAARTGRERAARKAMEVAV